MAAVLALCRKSGSNAEIVIERLRSSCLFVLEAWYAAQETLWGLESIVKCSVSLYLTTNTLFR